MGLYKYIAAFPNEGTREILIEADTPRDAADKLRARGGVPVRFCGEDGVDGNTGSMRRVGKVNTFEFTRQLAPLLDSSIPLERALAIIAEGATDPDQKNFVNSMRQGLHEGKKFSELVRSYGRLFPPYYANLIESGEETGCLPIVVNELQKFMAESKELKDFIVSSSIYPVVILSVTLIVTVLLFTVFVPRFTKIFIDMGRELTGAMSFLVTTSDILAWAWWLVPLLAVGGYYGLRELIGKEQMNYKLCSLLVNLPLAGHIAVDLEMCKYIRTMAILISNHVEIIRTVRICNKIIVNPVIAEKFSDIDRKLKGGEKLSAALRDNSYLPASLVPMLRVGEESGTVGEMLEKIAGNLENDTRIKIKRLLNLFEPAVIIFLAVIVLIVVVSIFTAMMEINSISHGGKI
ncbi:MAG: type II secretion system F family protein [Lentisphaeria bacterium]|nr:type II secretion system F family protein [Lentisphaeria bacterium]